MPIRGTQNIEGQWYYDFTNKRFRIDRSNGNFDRYCGTVYKFANTPCTQLVRDGKRYMNFPEKKFCCKCCTDAGGCGVIIPQFVEIGETQGRDDVNGTEAYKYIVKGLQSNFYWETAANKPFRFNQDPLSDMIWDSGYSENPITESVFDLPTDGGDCEQSCGFLTVCKALS